MHNKKDWQRRVLYSILTLIEGSIKGVCDMSIQSTANHQICKTSPYLRVHMGYKKYSDYSKIYCLDSQRSLFAVQALGKYKIKFTISQYGYSEIMLLSIETALDNVAKDGGKVLLEEIEL